MARHIFLIFLFFVTVACGANGQHGVSTDPNGATGFMTEIPSLPETAKDCRKKGIDLQCDKDGRPYGHLLLGERLPDIKSEFLDGSTFREDMIDRWTVIHVWGLWCGDSLADAPYTAKLYEAISRDPDTAFLSVAVPVSASRKTGRYLFGKYASPEAFYEEKGYRYPTLLDRDATLREALKISWTPSYLLVSPDGIVRGFRTDMSVAGDDPVADFLADIEAVRSAVKNEKMTTGLPAPKMDEDGILNLRGETVFTAPAMAAAFPGYDIVADRGVSDGASYPVYLIRQPGEGDEPGMLAFVIEPDWTHGKVRAVSTRNLSVQGPRGMTVRQTRLKDLPNDLRALCFVDEERFPERLACPNQPSDPTFLAIFGAGPDFDGPFLDAEEEYQGEGELIEMRYLPLPKPDAAPVGK